MILMVNPTDIVNKPVVKSVDVIDLIVGAVAKPMAEEAFKPYIGDATAKSGFCKLLVAFGCTQVSGIANGKASHASGVEKIFYEIGSKVSTGLAIGIGLDAGEDLMIHFNIDDKIKTLFGKTTKPANDNGF